MSAVSDMGFTGEWKDTVALGYPLGNGYRWYLPALMRFSAPDSLSPFGAGGINPYVYCADDPINNRDPSGHIGVDEALHPLDPSSMTIAMKGAETTASSVPHFEDELYRQWREYAGDAYVAVYEGYSELDYRYPKQLVKKLRASLNKLVDQYGTDNVVVVAGATSMGIGRVYEIAKREFGLRTAGFVSEEVKKYPEYISPFVDQIFYVNDPKATWDVTSPDGKSYMVKAATGPGGGGFFVYGGGLVTERELREAMKEKVPISLYPRFEPNPEEAQKRLEKKPGTELRPLVRFAKEYWQWMHKSV